MATLPRRASCRLLALAAYAWLPACGDVDASCAALSEEGLLVTAYIDHNGKQARTEIEVKRVEDDASLALALCKRSSISVDGTTATRVRRPSGSYVYKVDGVDKAKGGGAVTHELRLVDDDYEATYRVSVEAPAFEITAPKAGAELPRTQAFDVAWTPARPEATIVARIDDAIDGVACLAEPIVLELPDEGAAQVAQGQLKTGLNRPEPCSATLRLSRVATGALEPANGTSRLHADSRAAVATWRELKFTSDP
ncbi:hypothetical protein SAMN02745121_02486 [Nannocystis exedens]|uniref:Lipoprotein n=1 Tax=Nannocystis exedens TaxID=54 RepID=A0A1I1WWT8_9BACT|nr:hypothetical protein [Nannocystis exedens]PCC71042.1 hypothetical protein NAEX_04112 [Nannocystis exedens]SFD97913.1 hypothetical protein SAMN02745121_02486 [Nannocystis exedens]